MLQDIQDIIVKVALYAIPLLFAVVAHEVAHGWVAEKRGDPTARVMGRLTLNPLVHIDPVGTVILPIILLLIQSPFLFGWAKPVPVNFANLRGGRRDMALVALSGPLTNLLLAAASAGLYHFLLAGFERGWIADGSALSWVAEPLFLMAKISLTFNLVLMAFNLIPILPLDGGRILVGLLPEALAVKLEPLERYGMLIFLLLIGIPTLRSYLWGYFLNPIMNVFMRLFLG
jgi:Zn-dependent protease